MGLGYSTRNSLTFVNSAAIAYGQKVGRSLKILVYAIAVVFTNPRELRVQYYYYIIAERSVWIVPNLSKNGWR